MGSLGVEAPPAASAAAKTVPDPEKPEEEEEEVSPIEQVRLTVLNDDDPTMPVWTFRMWFLGLISCALLSFLNQFFAYRTEPLVISQITVLVATLPIGRFMAAVLPTTKFRLGGREVSLNPGPFNMKEHVLISIFANAGSAFGSGSAYAVGIINIIKAFYGRSISFAAGWLLIITTQVLGYGWAGLLRKYVVEPAHMWWPSTLVQVSLFRFDISTPSFFSLISLVAENPTCYALVIYLVMPIAYWGFNLYSANKFPIFSSHLFTSQGQVYNIKKIVNDKFELDMPAYEQEGRIHLSMFFALTYGFGFATIASTLTHVALFYGREIYERYKASHNGKEDIHTRLMKKYKDIPSWWFHLLLLITLLVSLALCIFMKDQIQMPWWGLIFSSILAFVFTLPISVITATTNQTPGLNIITEYIMGLIYPGRPIANVCFKTYGYMSMAQAVSFLNDFKLGHYMKIPPRSMFLVQFIGTILAGTINIAVAWWLLTSINNICQDQLLPPDSPWTCPGDRVFFDASVIWGLVGPKRIFGSAGNYSAMNWFFLGGALGPVILWLLHRAFPKQTWIQLINLPVLLGAIGMMPPATPLNYNAWVIVGTIFNFFVFRYRKRWWQRYNYILSAALDAGVAFMGVLLYFSLGLENKSVDWWGTAGEHCDLAACPTAKGIAVEGCPAF
ncbi:hypothetical protein SAY86_017305 [Trapa natans]|uniref:Oligopeptide transporter 4 n=1 Tax=Trapa natans TaxID=22666 RepID=A0AAN7LP27_TRANT|nr:hypothetical protein SAY86_017305 [Trapa natans]